MIPAKDVYRLRHLMNGVPQLQHVGRARAWSDVAALLHDTREGAGACLSREHSEGPRGFYLKGEQ